MENFYDQIAQEIASFTAIYSAFAKKHNLSYNDLHFLYYIATDKQVKAKDISNRWSIPKQTVNSMRHKFIREDLIAIQPDQTDKRQRILTLTKKGKTFMEPIVKKLNHAEKKASKSIDPTHFQNFISNFEHIRLALSKNLR